MAHLLIWHFISGAAAGYSFLGLSIVSIADKVIEYIWYKKQSPLLGAAVVWIVWALVYGIIAVVIAVVLWFLLFLLGLLNLPLVVFFWVLRWCCCCCGQRCYERVDTKFRNRLEALKWCGQGVRTVWLPGRDDLRQPSDSSPALAAVAAGHGSGASGVGGGRSGVELRRRQVRGMGQDRPRPLARGPLSPLYAPSVSGAPTAGNIDSSVAAASSSASGYGAAQQQTQAAGGSRQPEQQQHQQRALAASLVSVGTQLAQQQQQQPGGSVDLEAGIGSGYQPPPQGKKQQ